MSVFGFSEGQHVVAIRDVRGLLGFPLVRKGACGIVRARPSGFFSNRYLVEFDSGTLRVETRSLRPALFGHGEDAWRRRQQIRQGVALGLFAAFGAPALLAVLQHYLAGGNTAELVAALPGAALEAAADLLGLLGFWPVLAIAAVLYLRFRRS